MGCARIRERFLVSIPNERNEMLYADTKDATIKRVLEACAITNRNVSIEGATRIAMHGSRWDGGYKNEYYAVCLKTFEAKRVPVDTFGSPECDIPTDAAIVVFHYQGIRNSVSIYVHPDNLTRMLPAGNDVSDSEAIVLIWTAALKNTYAGETEIRFKRAKCQQGITRVDWDSAVESLKARKLLNKAGAITNDGRNAVQGHPLRNSAY